MNVRTQWGWWRLQYPTTALSAGSARHVVHLSAAGASTVRDFVQLHKPVTSWEYRATVSYTERSVNLWPRRCAGHTRCRCGLAPGATMIATNDAFIVGCELITTNDTLLATGWSRRTTHCWRWVFQLIRYLNETNSNKSCSVGRALWYFEYLHKPLGFIELYKRTTLLFYYVLQI